MNRRFVRLLVYVLVAAQLLLTAPVPSAQATASSTATADMPCAATMPQADDGKPCPCCPDGVRDMASCLGTCASAIGATPTFEIPARASAGVASVSRPRILLARFSEPPLKPPPIA